MQLTDNFKSFSDQDELQLINVGGSILPVQNGSKTYQLPMTTLVDYLGSTVSIALSDAFLVDRPVRFDKVQTLGNAKVMACANIGAQSLSTNLTLLNTVEYPQSLLTLGSLTAPKIANLNSLANLNISGTASVAGLVSLERLSDTIGLVLQTAANTYDIQLIGVNTPNSIPSLAHADARYLLQSNTGAVLTQATLSGYTEAVAAANITGHGALCTLDITSATVITATLTASVPCSFTMPAAVAGKSFKLLLKQPAGGVGTASWTTVKWQGGGSAPTITQTPGRMDILSFVSDGSNWYGSYVQNF